MKHRMILLLVLLCAGRIGLAQKFYDSSSPESMALIRGVNLSVNKSTGTAGVNIPLYTIAAGGIEVPVSINYICSGIKIKDIATWVGTGWNLSAGGKITRIVMDEDDKGGYIGSNGVQTGDVLSWRNEAVFNSRYDNKFDSEPDLFYFEIPGQSGMFVFYPDGAAYTIPYSNLKITHNNLSDFKITDASGVVYSFGAEEMSTVIEGETTKSYVSAWNLIKIKNINGDEVNFNYEKGAEQRYTNYNQIKFSDESSPTDKNVQIKTTPYFLTGIAWSNGRLAFHSSSSRNDIVNGRRLNKISVYSYEDKLLKNIDFTYSDFASKRLRLDRVSESDQWTSLPMFRFEYNQEQNLPGRDSKDFDHWGYYNGKNNPNFYAANREVSFGHVKANILTKVYNNMGGYEVYEYEANQLPDILMSGVRVKSIKKYDGKGNLCDNVQFSYGNGTHYPVSLIYDNNLAGTTVYYTYGTININDIGGSNVYYGKVTETLLNGSKKEYTYTTYTTPNCTDIKSQVYLTKSSDAPQENSEWNLYPNTSQFWKRGLLLSERSYAANSAVPEDETIYTYELDNAVKKEITCVIPNKYSTMVVVFGKFVHYKWVSQPLTMKSTLTTGKNLLTTKVENTYDMDNLVLTEQLTTINNTDKFKIKMKYPCHYSTSNNEINLLVQNGIIHIPVEKISYKNNEVVGGELVLFKPGRNSAGISVPVQSQKKVLLLDNPLANGFAESSVVNGRFSYDSRYHNVMTYDDYDAKLNLISGHLEDGVSNSVIYGYNSSLPVAQVVNAVATKPGSTEGENQVFHTSFEDVAGAVVSETAKTGNKVWRSSYKMNFGTLKPGTYILSYWRSAQNRWILEKQELTFGSGVSSYTINSSSYPIDEVRLMPQNATMTTCTYIPGVGKTSETDQNGRTIYYQYDGFGRLIKVMDNDRNLLKSYAYFIKE